MSDRWQMYSQDDAPAVAAGWSLETITGPSRLAGCNGMTFGPDGRLYATQVFGLAGDGDQHRDRRPRGVLAPRERIIGPDDGFFAADGTFYATEPLIGRVSARNPDGTYRVVGDDLPAANGVTMDHAGRRLFIDEFRPGGRLMELDPSGESAPRIFMEDLNGPNAPAMGPDGRIYFPQVFANEIWVYDIDSGKGELLFKDLNVPTAVKFDSRGRIVTSESGAGPDHRHRHRDRAPGDAGRGAQGHRQRLRRARRPHLRVALRRRPGGRGDRQPAPHPVGARACSARTA